MKTTRRSQDLSPYQFAYLTARAAADVLNAKAGAAIAALGLVYTDDMAEDVELAMLEQEEEIKEAAGVYAAREALYAAERNLCAWAEAMAIDTARRLGRADSVKDLVGIAKRSEGVPSVRRKMVEAALRLAA